ncbi:hypothetical protein GCM10022281_22300 [Sphingomonas rosea]|uniref:Uncharacterized protein n=1 Tax=Sphingomonas rosea TaxID=335605 RepID=A0ABP7UD80_9SPHN
MHGSDNDHDQAEHSASVPAPEHVPHALLTELGIVSRQQTSFEWGGFRYTNALDAIAAAKRARK